MTASLETVLSPPYVFADGVVIPRTGRSRDLVQRDFASTAAPTRRVADHSYWLP
jgi:hypothetical protein